MVILSKDIGVEDLDLFILDGSLEVKIWEPPMSPHLLIHFHGEKHLHVHIPLNDELVFQEMFSKDFNTFQSWEGVRPSSLWPFDLFHP